MNLGGGYAYSHRQVALTGVRYAHRFNRVRYQVEYDLLDLDSIALDPWQIASGFDNESDPVLFRFTFHGLNDIEDRCFDIKVDFSQSLFFEERACAINNAIRSAAIFDYSVERLPHLAETGRLCS